MDRTKMKLLIRNNISKFALVIELLIIFLTFQILTNGIFTSYMNFTNLLMQGCTYAIIGIGMVLVMVTGGIDLSAGSVLGFSCSLAALMECDWNFPVPVTILITLACGALIGCWQGFWIAYRDMPPFIATLAGQLVFRGMTLLIGKGEAIGPVGDKFASFGRSFLPNILFKESNFNDLSLFLVLAVVLAVIFRTIRKRKNRKKYGFEVPRLSVEIAKTAAVCSVILIIAFLLLSYKGIPFALVVLGILAIIFSFIAENTPFGRSVYAIGGNRDAAKLSGINIKRTVFFVYVLMGLIIGCASIVFLGRVGQATSSTGTNFEFSAITGCIVGGTSTLGGSGTIIGAIIGTIMMASLDNGMSLLNLGTTYQYLIKGLVLLGAVAIDISSKRK
ncbi:sugar ABC transporter permease [Diplocloster agilis]|uniref:sugar ABC transporter permease n=1 Tax=Diplocloster agilis TaxID=2850323 RepID=UPI000822AA13|nr:MULTISPECIES: sugar ABC transporter permease [Lachnospiraceae]MBU9742486.1 sugar ABC transporter permease [Diplocloster agilis]MCU6733553.1 sugar ABC transporter permease [Suonthocola fibrivorans]SCI98204.1 Xylose transport system permease protein xylH [uncultured Clostridium sp.]